MSDDVKVSPYTILTRWFFDGSRDNDIPKEIIEDKSINQMYLLHYFKSSKYGVYINQVFNNWNLFSLDRIEVFKFMKLCIQLTGYKPPFITKTSTAKNKLAEELKFKYPYFRSEEISMLVEKIDNSEEKDSIYEMFGFHKPKNKKLTEKEKKSREKIVPKINESDNLLENFV